ncbi:hypothetical protein SUGI_0788010 [Cryptomeria japonica]|nr:hypothetical protein SUGI_0788010 [Cryptomeria japonica]
MEGKNSNSAQNSSFPRENTLNPDSAKNLKNRENRAISASFAGGSEFRENSAINAVNLDSEVNLNFEARNLEEVQVQVKDKAIGTSQPAIDDAKLSPDGGSKVRRSKRSEGRPPSKSPIYVRRWSNDQEICLMNAILDTRTPHGKVNRAAFYQRVREQLELEVSNSKLYEKMKNMKKKFRSMVKKRKEGKLVIQTAHQHTMFLLWENLWGTIESEGLNPKEKGTESSRPNEMEARGSNSAENSSSPREDTLNPDSAKNLKNRENRAIKANFAEGSEFTKNSAINDVNLNFVAKPKHMENKAKQSLQEETHGENTKPNFTTSPKHMENKAKRSLREETQGENTHLLEESIHQETNMENARVNGPFVEKCPHQEIHVGNAKEIGHAVDGSGLPQIQFRGLESRIESSIENSIKGIETRIEANIQNSIKGIETRLEAAIQNSVTRVVIATVTAAAAAVTATATATAAAAAVFYICIYLMRMGTS